MTHNEVINVRYMVSDVDESIVFYTKFLDFEVLTNFAPAFADVQRGNLRLLLAGPKGPAAGRSCLRIRPETSWSYSSPPTPDRTFSNSDTKSPSLSSLATSS